jgi:hypothetical protein
MLPQDQSTQVEPGDATEVPNEGMLGQEEGVDTFDDQDSGLDYDAAQQAIQAAETLRQDVNRMRSVYDQNFAQFQSEAQRREEELMDQLASFQTADMSEEDRAAFYAERGQEKLSRREQAIQQREDALQSREQQTQWRGFFSDRLGVPTEELVTDQGLAEFYTSGWAGVERMVDAQTSYIEELESVLATNNLPIPREQPITRQPQGRRAPNVRTRVEDGPPPKRGSFYSLPWNERAEIIRRIEAGEMKAEDVQI